MNADLPNFPLPIPETRSPDHNCGGDAHLSEEESSISVDKTQGNKGPKRLKEDDTISENESKCHRTSTPETNHDVVKELKLSQPEDTDQSSNYGQVTGDNHASESQQLGNSSLLITKSKVFSSISSELDVEKSRDCQHLEGGQIPQRILEREDEVKAFAQTDEKLSSIDGEIDAKSRDCRMNKDLEHSLEREDKVYACPDGGNDTTDHHSASDTVSITSELVTRPNTSGSVDNEHHVDTTSLDSVSGRSKNSSDNEGGDSISAKRGLNGNVSASKELDYNTPTSDRSNTGSSVTKPDNDLNHEHQPDDSVTLITKLVNHNPAGGAEDTITSLPKDFSPIDGEIDVKMSRDCRMNKDLEERQIHQHSLEREDEVYDCPETDKILLDGGNETADHPSASDTVNITSELVTRPNTSGSASKESDDNTPANNRDNTDSFFTKPDNNINHEHQPDGSVTLIPKLVNHNPVGRAEDSITFFPKTDQLAISPVVDEEPVAHISQTVADNSCLTDPNIYRAGSRCKDGSSSKSTLNTETVLDNQGACYATCDNQASLSRELNKSALLNTKSNNHSISNSEINAKKSMDCRMLKDIQEQIHQGRLDCTGTDEILLHGGHDTVAHHSAGDTISRANACKGLSCKTSSVMKDNTTSLKSNHISTGISSCVPAFNSHPKTKDSTLLEDTVDEQKPDDCVPDRKTFQHAEPDGVSRRSPDNTFIDNVNNDNTLVAQGLESNKSACKGQGCKTTLVNNQNTSLPESNHTPKSHRVDIPSSPKPKSSSALNSQSNIKSALDSRVSDHVCSSDMNAFKDAEPDEDKTFSTGSHNTFKNNIVKDNLLGRNAFLNKEVDCVSPIDRDQTSSSQSTSLDISANNGHKGNATTSGTQKHNSNLKLRPKHTTNSLECSGLHKEHLEGPKLLSGGPAQHKQVSDRGFDDRMSSGSRTKNRASSSSNNKALGKEANFNGSVGQELDNTADVTKEVNSIHSPRSVTIDAFETGRDKGYNCAKETAMTNYTSIDLSKDKNKRLLQSGEKRNLKTRMPNLVGENLKTRTPSNEELVPGVGKTKADQEFEKAHLRNVGELKYLGSKVKSTWLLWILLIFILILPTLASREKNWQQFFFCTDNTSLKNDTLTIKNLDTLSLDGCSSDVADIPHFFNCSLLKALAFVFNNTCLEMLTLDLKTQWWKMEYGKKFNGQGLSPARGELFTDEDVEKKLDSYERFRNPVSTISPTSTTELTNNGQRARWPLIPSLVFDVIIILLSWKFLQKPPQNNHQDQQLQPTSGQEDVETAETET